MDIRKMMDISARHLEGGGFGFHNSKIVGTSKEYGLIGASFDLLSGWTCPAANLCHSRVIENEDGSRTREDLGEFVCYATKSELLYKNVYDLHKRNEEITRQENFVELMNETLFNLPLNLVRIHSAGDFYDFTYFKKWVDIAYSNPQITFFGYTKQASFVKYLLAKPFGNLLENLKIVYSFGGLHDNYALKNNLPSCTVVTDDFAQNIHGTIETYEEDSSGFNWRYDTITGTKRGKPVYRTVYSPYKLEYGQFYNHYKKVVEDLSCMHDTPRSRVDDFERIMRLESFGIRFH